MKCPLLSFSFFSFFLFPLSAQDMPVQKESSFSTNLSYTGDVVSSFFGGIKSGSCYLGMVNAGFSFDTEKAGLWKGGQFFFYGTNTHGSTPSASLVGDFQVTSNIEAGDMTFIQEFWYMQRLGKLSTTIGVQDLNAGFAFSEGGSMYLNSSFGVHSTITNNIPSPIFPLTAFGWQLQYDFSEKTNVKIVLFDGLPDGMRGTAHNLPWDLSFEEGYLAVVEADHSVVFSENLSGTYKIGGYYHNHLGKTFNSDNCEDHGFYMVADQELFRNTEDRVLSAFIQASVSPASKNENSNYLGAGLNYKKPFSCRPDDVLGLAVARAGLNHRFYSNETAVEMTYRAQLTGNFYLQPDIQYIVHPSGTEENLDNALVGIVRFGLDF